MAEVPWPVQEINSEGRIGTPESPGLPVLSTFGGEFRLTCPICLQDLKQPKQLKPCYHIFCADCIRPSVDGAGGESVNCPQCQKSCLKDDITQALGTSSYLHGIDGQMVVYAESGDMLCSEHAEGDSFPASHFCLECGKNFCETCHGHHGESGNFRNHHCLRLFETMSTMTLGINRSLVVSPEADGRPAPGKCPVCRNSDNCDHEVWLRDLADEAFRTNDECPIPEHEEGNRLIAYCTDENCQRPICRNCSMIEHRDHRTVDIRTAMDDKLLELKALKKNLEVTHDIFDAAARRGDKAESFFRHHVYLTEQEMMGRKREVQTKVEESFRVAFNLIERTGRKQQELNKQSIEMKEEEVFLSTAMGLADQALTKEEPEPLEVVRTWKGLDFIVAGLRGQGLKVRADGAQEEPVLPQEIVEKRLVLPAPNCMNPDLRILKKVSVEGTILRQAFVLKAEDELLLFYSILPLTETEALVSCKTQACATSMVQYSHASAQRHSVSLRDQGQYSIIAVPGNGIVATLYQAPGESCNRGSQGKKEVLFWDQALDRSMQEHEAKGAGEELKMFAETELPPRGVAVTGDNHLVLCTAQDLLPADAAEGQGEASSIVIMTMKGDVLRSKALRASSAGPNNSHYFPRYVTVNINGDICITDKGDRSIIILDRNLTNEYPRIRNPYDDDSMNSRFYPMGICHDAFGRLIVADSDNHTVLRFQLGQDQLSSPAQVLLKDGRDGVRDLSYPTLVALGPGAKLWVVCRTNIQVFDYIDPDTSA